MRNKNYPKFKVNLVHNPKKLFIFTSQKDTSINIEIDEKNRELLRHLVTGEAEIFKLIPVKEDR